MCNAALHYLTHFDALHQFKISDVLIICRRCSMSYGFVQYAVDVEYKWTDA